MKGGTESKRESPAGAIIPPSYDQAGGRQGGGPLFSLAQKGGGEGIFRKGERKGGEKAVSKLPFSARRTGEGRQLGR